MLRLFLLLFCSVLSLGAGRPEVWTFNLHAFGSLDQQRRLRLSDANGQRYCDVAVPAFEWVIECPLPPPGVYKWQLLDQHQQVLLVASMVSLPAEFEEPSWTPLSWDASSSEARESYRIRIFKADGERVSSQTTEHSSVLMPHQNYPQIVLVYQLSRDKPNVWWPIYGISAGTVRRVIDPNSGIAQSDHRWQQMQMDAAEQSHLLPTQKRRTNAPEIQLSLFATLLTESSLIKRTQDYSSASAPNLGWGAELSWVAGMGSEGQIWIDGHRSEVAYEKAGSDAPDAEQMRAFLEIAPGWSLANWLPLTDAQRFSVGPALTLARLPIDADNQTAISGGIQVSFAQQMWDWRWRLHGYYTQSQSYGLRLQAKQGAVQPSSWILALLMRKTKAKREDAESSFDEIGLSVGWHLPQ